MHSEVVIIGAGGMLGQDLAAVYADKRPVLLDRTQLDITDSVAVRNTLEELKPLIVLNAAAFNAVDDAESEPGRSIAFAVNGDGPGNLAAACSSLGATFVHFSSDYVFSGTKKNGYAEDDQPDPQSEYAKSKRAGEENVLKHEGQMFVIRTCRLFGKPGVSEVSKKSFVDTMLSLVETKSELNVVNEEIASPTYTVDLAQHTRAVLEGAYAPGIYHITNSGSCTWYEFAQEIFKAAGKTMTLHPVPAATYPRPAARPACSVLRNTKLPGLRSWQEAVREYIQAR